MTKNVATIVDRRLTNLAIVLERTPRPYAAPGQSARVAHLDYATVYRTLNMRLAENTVDPGWAIEISWAPWHKIPETTHTEAVIAVQDANCNTIIWKWVLPVPGEWNCAAIAGMLDPRCAIIYEDDIIDEVEEAYFRGLAILKEHYKAELRNHLLNTARLYPAEDIPPQRNNRCILLDTR